MHRSNRVVAIRLQLCNINCTNAVCLNRIDVDDEAILGLASVENPCALFSLDIYVIV